MPTINDVSRLAGVSKTTVSRVLNTPELVNVRTRTKVLEVIQKLNYSPSIIARGMRGQKTNMIGVIIPDITNLFYSEFLKHVEKAAVEKGYIVVICSTEVDPGRELEYMQQLMKRQIDGLILCRYRSVREDADSLGVLARRIPIVVMDQPSDGFPVSAVYTDARGGIKELTSYLLKSGYRRIAILCGYKKYPFSLMRFGGYEDALREYGLAIDPDLVVECDSTAADGFRAAERLMKHAMPEAVVAVTDLIALGAMRYLQDNGYSVPGDVAIAGFDNIPLSSLSSPQLTTVSQPIERMAAEAVQQLLRRVQNSRVHNRDIVLENTLVIRESTGSKKKDQILM
jgi:DNA-binding LacI/PurR family transcriptional regulator